jgi:Asp-tRNA(Asn)/Glu-tRNA(Gln) amidotransferase A subunit family amidase
LPTAPLPAARTRHDIAERSFVTIFDATSCVVGLAEAEREMTQRLFRRPSVVVPVALHQGRPVGVQLIAGRYREDLCLDAAEAIEEKAGILVQHGR